MSIKAETNRLGDILVSHNVISKADLDSVLAAQNGANLRIGELLIRKGLITEDNLYNALAIHYGMPYQKKLEYNDPTELLKKIPGHFLKKNKLVPFNVVKKIVLVGISDALNVHPFDDLKMLLPDYSFEPVLTREEEIQRMLSVIYDTGKDGTASDVIDSIDDSDFDMLSPLSETEDILDMANEAPIIKLVNKIITEAVNSRASDIHIEPYEKDLLVRFRVDGILYKMHTPPKKLQSAIISRLKIMSNLNIAENRLPQDGRIQIKIGTKDIDIRVSIFPTHYGERVVLRLLNKTDMSFELEKIGFQKHMLDKFKKVIEKPHGILLVTGPTGSGKSTTLYCVLTKLNSPDVNILTVEDPIEYQLQGVGQMQVKTKIDLTFASGLRSILRQDPDIIMVGEIRDLETAEIAVQSALTGHSVFSTLHTNDAASGVTRLLDMGIEPFLIASSINAFLAQRLIRTLCPKCKAAYKPTKNELSDAGIKQAQLKNGKIFKPKGCDACLNTGYSGRTGIYELLPISNPIRKLVMSRADAEQIKDLAVKEGMRTLLNDGVEKVLAGVTSLEEVIRVCGV